MSPTGTMRSRSPVGAPHEDGFRAGAFQAENRRLVRSALLKLVLVLVIGTVIVWALSDPRQADKVERRTLLGSGPQEYSIGPKLADSIGLEGRLWHKGYSALPRARRHALVTVDPLNAELLEMTGRRPISSDQTDQLMDWVRSGGTWLVTHPATRVIQMRDGFMSLRMDQKLVGEPTASLADQVLGDAPTPELAPFATALEGGGRLQMLRATIGPFEDPERWWPAMFEPEAEGAPPGRETYLWNAFSRVDPWEPVLRSDGRPIAITRRYGAGQVVLCSSPLLFTNRALAYGKTGEAAMGLLWLASDRGKRELLWDAYAQGLQVSQGLTRWIRDAELWMPLLGVTLLAALLAWRGWFRLGAPDGAPPPSRRSVEEFVVTLADLQRSERRHGTATKHILDAGRLVLRQRGLPIRSLADPDLEPQRTSSTQGSAEALRRASQAVDQALADRKHS